MFTFKISGVWHPEYLYDYINLRHEIDGLISTLLELLSTAKVASTVSTRVTVSSLAVCWNQCFVSSMLFKL